MRLFHQDGKGGSITIYADETLEIAFGNWAVRMPIKEWVRTGCEHPADGATFRSAPAMLEIGRQET